MFVCSICINDLLTERKNEGCFVGRMFYMGMLYILTTLSYVSHHYVFFSECVTSVLLKNII